MLPLLLLLLPLLLLPLLLSGTTKPCISPSAT
jgi:hypothetical protein